MLLKDDCADSSESGRAALTLSNTSLSILLKRQEWLQATPTWLLPEESGRDSERTTALLIHGRVRFLSALQTEG